MGGCVGKEVGWGGGGGGVKLYNIIKKNNF
jgi:hypothetical protein